MHRMMQACGCDASWITYRNCYLPAVTSYKVAPDLTSLMTHEDTPHCSSYPHCCRRQGLMQPADHSQLLLLLLVVLLLWRPGVLLTSTPVLHARRTRA